jgi:ABC-type uncharacterized transport system ATPase subunit
MSRRRDSTPREQTKPLGSSRRRVKRAVRSPLWEHDASFSAICDQITVVGLGQVLARGTPDEIIANPEVRKAYLGEIRDLVEIPGPQELDKVSD